jgi:LacI family transcriptional regulator
MPHTMSEVAACAGVSKATVSRVLSRSHYIAPETARRVLQAVRELNYHKNVHARRLATGRSDLFGLVISEIANPFFPEIIRGFQAEAWERGFDVLLCNTEYSPGRTGAIMQKLIESDVRGVAIVTSSLDEHAVDELVEAGIGTVFCNLGSSASLISNIAVDYLRGISQAIEHVVKLGHRRATVISGPEDNRTAIIIKNALVSGLRRHKMDPHPVLSSDYRVDAGASAVKSVLAAKEKPTVIFCGSDLIAMGAMNALEQAGVRVPRDMSVIGIDDISFAFLARPPLTTIRVPREQLGRIAFQSLEKMLKLKRHKGQEYYLETELIVRQSTTAARQKSQTR